MWSVLASFLPAGITCVCSTVGLYRVCIPTCAHVWLSDVWALIQAPTSPLGLLECFIQGQVFYHNQDGTQVPKLNLPTSLDRLERASLKVQANFYVG